MLMLLLALLCLFIGVVTEVALRQYLVGQTDQRLEGARDRLVERGFGPRYNPGPHGPRLPQHARARPARSAPGSATARS